MTARPIKLITIAAFLLMSQDLLFAKSAKINWQSGRVIFAAVNGQGPGNSGAWRTNSTDIWWNYFISTEEQCYSVVSRQAPLKIGLTNNSMAKFYISRNQMYVEGPDGKNVELRISRKDKKKTCP
jgi:hypothetical protein